MASPQSERSEIERMLQDRFNPENALRITGKARENAASEHVKDLVLPREQRGPLPYSREDLVISENPALVEWEREVRAYLKQLATGQRGHRITAKMIYTWATGIIVEEQAAAEGVDPTQTRGGAQSGSANSHLRHISKVLQNYFGTPYKTTIMNRPVGRAYTVRRYFRIKEKKPMCLTLWPEYDAGTLDNA